MPRTVILLKNASVPSDPYETRFREEGFEPFFVPLLTHTHFDRNQTIDYLKSQEFLEAPTFIITSQRAVEMLEDLLSELDDDIRSIICDKKGYTVGPATYNVLKRIGFKDVRGGENAGNGKLLAEFIDKEAAHLKSDPIIFFTGEIRKDIIPRMLKSWGYNFQEKVIYKTENRDDIVENFEKSVNGVSGTRNWIVFYSPQGTESIVRYLKKKEDLFSIACIGPTTEEYLLEQGLVPKVVSPKPNATTLVDAILKV